jgi:ATP-dependent DNA helicase PIF1
MQCTILAPKNTDVDEVNNAILESLFEELHTYLSVNFLAPTEEGASANVVVSMDSLYPVEFMNTLQFSDIANHKLELKVGVPILLLRNFNQSIGLCNGTRLIVKRWVSVSLKRRSSQGTMLANMCSYPALSCPPPGLIGHLFCVIVNFLFESHLR